MSRASIVPAIFAALLAGALVGATAAFLYHLTEMIGQL